MTDTQWKAVFWILMGMAVAMISLGMIGADLWPNPPNMAAFGVLFATLLIGAACGAVIHIALRS